MPDGFRVTKERIGKRKKSANSRGSVRATQNADRIRKIHEARGGEGGGDKGTARGDLINFAFCLVNLPRRREEGVFVRAASPPSIFRRTRQRVRVCVCPLKTVPSLLTFSVFLVFLALATFVMKM